jgi:hypothetical protein
MPTVTRKIGLSLGADICWPIAFEEILANSRLQIGIDKETIGFASQRMPLRPFSLQDPSDYDMVVDRLTHWFPLRREWIKKAILMDDLYVLPEAQQLLRDDGSRHADPGHGHAAAEGIRAVG